MEHNHSHNNDINLSIAFKIGITINIIFVTIEALFGYLSNSMALIADAGHNLSDVLALAFSWMAIILSQRKPTMKFTYGFRRSTILIALLNTILLLAAVVFIVYETIERLSKTAEINANSVMIVASIGIVVNAFTAWLFLKGKKHDLNVRSAFVHFVADALVSMGVVVAGVIMAFTGIQWIDSLVSLTIVAVILYSSYHLLIDSVNLALDAVPENINIEEVSEFLKKLPEVSGVHDLHIWALSTIDAALTVHLTTWEQTDVSFITSIQNQLHERFRIEHATIQVEFGTTEDCGIKY
ncbi:MAG: cation diffusion facilitator family transporter [Bacteroidales bacterium]|nr:cation diffusion facilitator family transporter [Bacteroidales bacterium]